VRTLTPLCAVECDWGVVCPDVFLDGPGVVLELAALPKSAQCNMQRLKPTQIANATEIAADEGGPILSPCSNSIKSR
jgi:hypothetical protein